MNKTTIINALLTAIDTQLGAAGNTSEEVEALTLYKKELLQQLYSIHSHELSVAYDNITQVSQALSLIEQETSEAEDKQDVVEFKHKPQESLSKEEQFDKDMEVYIKELEAECKALGIKVSVVPVPTDY